MTKASSRAAAVVVLCCLGAAAIPSVPAATVDGSTRSTKPDLGAYQVIAASKTARDKMSPEQKKELRRKAYEWCRKKHAPHGDILRVEILSDGSVRCWVKN